VPGVDVDAANTDGQTPLFTASAPLLAEEVDGESVDGNAATAAVVAALLLAGANPNAVDASGYTPLHWAPYYGHTAIVTALLAHQGILVNTVTTDGLTPLKAAKLGGEQLGGERERQSEIIRLLKAAGGAE